MSNNTSQPTDALKDEGTTQNIESLLSPFGYASLFSHCDEIQDAFTFVTNVGEAVGDTPKVVTACMVYVNTLLRVLHHNGMLNLEHSPLHKRIAELEEKYAKLLEATGCELEEFTSVIKN